MSPKRGWPKEQKQATEALGWLATFLYFGWQQGVATAVFLLQITDFGGTSQKKTTNYPLYPVSPLFCNNRTLESLGACTRLPGYSAAKFSHRVSGKWRESRCAGAMVELLCGLGVGMRGPSFSTQNYKKRRMITCNLEKMILNKRIQLLIWGFAR